MSSPATRDVRLMGPAAVVSSALICLCPGDCGCHPGNRRPNVCGCRGHVERRPCSANGYALEVQGVDVVLDASFERVA